MAGFKKIIVLSGIPSSGKTTIGKLLNKKGYFYVPEIAEQLIKKGVTTGVDANPMLDKTIMEVELQRDKYLFSLNKNLLVIETWHPGNIAYACLRNPPIAKQYKQIFQKILKYHKVFGIYLNIPLDIFWKRTVKYKRDGRQEIVMFFKRLQNEILACHKEFGIPLVKINSNQSKKTVFHEVLDSIKNL